MNFRPVYDFDFSESTVDEYIHGDCWYLALALSNHLNLPVVAIWGDREIQHVGVELPNNNVVDIMGVWRSDSWSGYWYDELDACDDVYYDGVDEEDDNWCNALSVYSDEMLTQQIAGGSPTLGETMEEVLRHLRTVKAI